MMRRCFALAALGVWGCGGDRGTNPTPSTTGGIAEARAAVDGPATLAVAGVINVGQTPLASRPSRVSRPRE